MPRQARDWYILQSGISWILQFLVWFLLYDNVALESLIAKSSWSFAKHIVDRRLDGSTIFQNTSLKTTKMASSKPSASKASTKKQPTLSSVYKSYGGHHRFLYCHGLKPWNYEDVEEGEAIAAEMLKGDAESEAENVSTQASAVENRDHSHLQDRRDERVGNFEVENRDHCHLQDRRYDRVGNFEVENRDHSHLQDRRYERAGTFQVENRDRIQDLNNLQEQARQIHIRDARTDQNASPMTGVYQCRPMQGAQYFADSRW